MSAIKASRINEIKSEFASQLGFDPTNPPVNLGRVRISILHNETEKISLLNSNTYKGAFLCLVTYSHLPLSHSKIYISVKVRAGARFAEFLTKEWRIQLRSATLSRLS